ncbi:adenosine deaminase family protein [Acetobacter conturbans]|nr:adenosine deaminase [Acetobacter conturbans]
MIRRLLPALLSISLSHAALAASISGNEAAATATRFETIRADPTQLSVFMRGFPKGADLHNHLVGAIYAEHLLEWAREDQLCVNPVTGAIGPAKCVFGFHASREAIPAQQVIEDSALYAGEIDALSMRNFVPTQEEHSGHDHFFATFDRFLPATTTHDADMLVDALTQAARDHITYIELMVSPELSAVARLGSSTKVADEKDISHAEVQLTPHLRSFVKLAGSETDSMEHKARAALKCDTKDALPGCNVTVRYLYQTVRTMPPGMVLAQIAFGYALTQADPRFVGINIVGAEDNPIAMHDYTLHMQMFHVLSEHWPDVKLSLHAGELSEGLVPPEGLDTHIRQAVEIAGASRIGHGVDIMQERDPYGLLDELARHNILVEINLTSNAQILNIQGPNHPFMTYRAHGVPVALSTDDQGVSRSTLTSEYIRATITYGLSYPDLKDLSRMGLEHAFLPGKSLWESTRPFRIASVCASVRPLEPSDNGPCHDLLSQNEKATLQWKLEGDFARFEHRMAAGEPLQN